MDPSPNPSLVGFHSTASPHSLASSISYSGAVTEDTHSDNSNNAILVTGAGDTSKQKEEQAITSMTEGATKTTSGASSDASGLDGMFLGHTHTHTHTHT